jgi:hypothetical protein
MRHRYEMACWYEKAPLPKKKAISSAAATEVPRCPLTGRPLGLKLPERVGFTPNHPEFLTHCLRRRVAVCAVPNVLSARLLATSDIHTKGASDPKLIDSAQRYLTLYRPWRGKAGATDVPTDASEILEEFELFAFGTSTVPPTRNLFAATLMGNDDNEQITRRIDRKITSGGDDLEYNVTNTTGDNDAELLDDLDDLFAQEDAQIDAALHPSASYVLNHFRSLSEQHAPPTDSPQARFLGCGPTNKCVTCGLLLAPAIAPAAPPGVGVVPPAGVPDLVCPGQHCPLFQVNLLQEQALEEATRRASKPFTLLADPLGHAPVAAQAVTPQISDLVADLRASALPLQSLAETSTLPALSLLHRASLNPTKAPLVSGYLPLNELQHKGLVVMAAALLAGYCTANPDVLDARELIELAESISGCSGPIQMALLGKGGTGEWVHIYPARLCIQ